VNTCYPSLGLRGPETDKPELPLLAIVKLAEKHSVTPKTFLIFLENNTFSTKKNQDKTSGDLYFRDHLLS